MAKAGMQKLHSYLRNEEGIKVDRPTREILAYFEKNVLVSFLPSGSSGYTDQTDEKLGADLNMPEDTVFEKRIRLERAGILGSEKGLSSVGGKEFEYGLTGKAKRILYGSSM